MSDAPSEGLRPVLWLALALAVTAVAWANVFDVGFVWDDHALIEGPLAQGRPLSVRAHFAGEFWDDPLDLVRRHYYRPLVTLSFGLDRAWGGNEPAPFHLTNLLAHLLAVAAVFVLARGAGASASRAFLLAALFGTFPRLTESVTWVSGRTDVFAGAAVLWALAVHRRGGGPLWRSVAAALLLLVGLLCKEVALAGAAALVVRELGALRSHRAPSKAAARLLPVLAVSLGWFVVRSEVVAVSPDSSRSLGDRVVLAAEAVATYAQMVLTPWLPSLQIGDASRLSLPRALVGLALLAVAGTALLRFRRRLPVEVWALLGVGAAALVPVLHVFPLDFSTLAADRFLYLPVAVLLLATVPLPLPPRLAGTLGGLLLASFVGATGLRNADWHDEVRLWKRTLAQNDTAGARGALGDACFARFRFVEARAEYATVVERVTAVARAAGREPDLRLAKASLAKADEALGERAAVQAIYDDLLQGSGGWKRLAYNRVLLGLRFFDFDAADAELRRARERLGAADPTLSVLEAVVRQSRQSAASLPPWTSQAPPDAVAGWAQLADTNGGIALARRGWRQVLALPDASPAQLEHAVGYLAFKAEPADARAALALAAQRGLSAAVLASLTRVVDDRSGE